MSREDAVARLSRVVGLSAKGGLPKYIEDGFRVTLSSCSAQLKSASGPSSLTGGANRTTGGGKSTATPASALQWALQWPCLWSSNAQLKSASGPSSLAGGANRTTCDGASTATPASALQWTLSEECPRATSGALAVWKSSLSKRGLGRTRLAEGASLLAARLVSIGRAWSGSGVTQNAPLQLKPDLEPCVSMGSLKRSMNNFSSQLARSVDVLQKTELSTEGPCVGTMSTIATFATATGGFSATGATRLSGLLKTIRAFCDNSLSTLRGTTATFNWAEGMGSA